MKALEEFLRPTQKGLYKILSKMYPNAICSKKEYILVPGEAPIMLLAHLDTVHSQPVQTICKNKDKNILMSPQGIGGDDRCGVYAIVNAYDMAVKKPWLLFTCDEEIGGLGADQFCHAHADCKLPKELDDLKLLVEIDRRGSNDAVYYDCDNEEFEKYITSKGFKTAFGSFSDISVVAPELGVAAVNLSSGYYNAHTLHEYINRRELDAVLQKVNEIVADAVQPNFPKYKYVERKEFEYNSTYYSKYYQQITYHDGKKTTIWVDSQGKERIAPKYTRSTDLWDKEEEMRFNDAKKNCLSSSKESTMNCLTSTQKKNWTVISTSSASKSSTKSTSTNTAPTIQPKKASK